MRMRHALTVACSPLFCTTLTARRAGARPHSKPPQTGPPPTLKLPAIQKRQLSNGLPVWIVELHEVPVVQVNLVVLSGSADDPAGKFGIASLTASMLVEGAGSRSALEIADAVDFLGADLAANSGSDMLRGPAARAGRPPRRGAADHGRRRAAADVPERRARAPARSSASPPSSRRATIRTTIGALAFARVLYGTSAPLRHRAGRHRADDPVVHRRTICGRSIRRHVPARQRRADRRRRRHRRPRGAAARDRASAAGSPQRHGAAARRRCRRRRCRRRARSTSSTSRAPRSRRSASAGSAFRAPRRTTSPSR